MKKIALILLGATIFTGLVHLSLAAQPPGSTTAPYTLSYSARLSSSTGTPVTTAQDVRFSIWTGSDFTAADLLPSGAIDPAAPGFTGWQETHTVTPDVNGLFQVRLGTISTLPNFTLANDVYLEVDVEPSGSPLTSFEVLDPSGSTADTNDRFPLDSSAYAINADTVDNHDAGSGPDQIPILDPGGLLPISTIPGGTNGDTFILDNNNDAPATVKLQFGNTLNKFLEYDPTFGYFNFNDNVNITGNLTTTGTINGVIIGPSNRSDALAPEYNDSVIIRDGTNNEGKLESFYVDADGAPGNTNINYYHWTTLQTGPQDIDIVIRYTLAEGFLGWQAIPMQFTYRTGTSSAADNHLDITAEDTAGNPIPLTGATNLTSTGFTTTSITFPSGSTFIPDQPITIHIKSTATNVGSADAGRIQFNYNGT